MLMPVSFVKNCLPIPEKVLFHDAWFAACACMENGINYSFDVINNYRQHGNNITYLSHNKVRKSFVSKMASRISILKDGTKTDRFFYTDELYKKYGFNNQDFKDIYYLIENVKNKKFGIKDFIFIWKNYFYINTKKSYRGFFKQLLIIKNWKQNND